MNDKIGFYQHPLLLWLARLIKEKLQQRVAVELFKRPNTPSRLCCSMTSIGMIWARLITCTALTHPIEVHCYGCYHGEKP